MCSCYAHRSNRSRGEHKSGGARLLAALPGSVSCGITGLRCRNNPTLCMRHRTMRSLIDPIPRRIYRPRRRPDSAAGGPSTGTIDAALALDDDSCNHVVSGVSVTDSESDNSPSSDDSPSSSLELLTGSVINRPGEFGIN